MKIWRIRPLYIFLNLIFRIVYPANWVNIFKVSYEWDKALNLAMDKGVKVHSACEGGYTVKIGNERVWISNFPYGYGHAYGSTTDRGKYRCPLHLTRYRLRRYIKKHFKRVESQRADSAKEIVRDSCEKLLDGLD